MLHHCLRFSNSNNYFITLHMQEDDHRFEISRRLPVNLVDRVRRPGKVCLIYVLIWCPVCASNAKLPPLRRYRCISISREAVCFIRNYLMSHFCNWGIFFRNLLTTGPSNRRD